jgi:hypothetical protein
MEKNGLVLSTSTAGLFLQPAIAKPINPDINNILQAFFMDINIYYLICNDLITK